jgi:raffinose/stachyose/melibiose transport system substrate-binding protein
MKKILSLTLAILMLLSAVGCAAKTEPAAESPAETASESTSAGASASAAGTSSATSTSASAAASSGIAGTTISVFATGYADDKVKVFQEIIDGFTNQTGVKVDLVTPGSDGETQLKTMMASNAMPDVWMTHGWSLLRYKDYLKTVNDQPWFSTIDTDSLSGVMADENGNFYALPMSMSISGLIYNKDALDKAGVDPNSIRTWDAFDAACGKLVAAGITPLVIGGSVGGNLAGLLGSVAPTFWTDKGAKYDMAAALKDGTFDFDTYGTELYKYIASWVQKGYINKDVLTLDAAGAQQMLGSGEAAFMVRGTDNITVARQYYPNANMGILPLPSSAAGAPSFRVGEGDAWGVWKDTKNEAACWALLAYLATPEVGTKWSAVSGALPTVNGVQLADVYTINCYRQAVKDCSGNVQYDNMFDRKYFPSGMWSIMGDSMSMLLDDPADVTPAVDYLKENYQSLYAEQKN